MRCYSCPDWFTEILINSISNEVHKNDVVCDCECRVISEEPIPIEECERDK